MENENMLELVKKVSKERDEIAFSQIFDFLAPKINSYFIKNSFNYQLSEELTQEVLSTIWTKASLYNPEKSKFTTWVFTIARNKKIDFYRKSKNSSINEDDLRDFMYEKNEVNDYDIQDTVEKINKELDINQRKLIKMNFFEQKSHKKIAEELEIPIGTVKSRIRTILNKMNKFLK
jgi:RNA polymerase sigma-70 factor, ECF subfamily